MAPGQGPFSLFTPTLTEFDILNDTKLASFKQGSASGTRFPGSGTGTETQICGTRDSVTQLWGTVPGTENFSGHGPGPVPTPGFK